MIIDSCVDEQGRPAALTYLESLGVNCATEVGTVLATHWHDDHVRGLAAVLEACETARFCLPVALRTKEFLKLTQAIPSGSEATTSGVREFGRVFDIVRDRRQAGSLGVGPRYVSENQIVDEGSQFEVRALSPSSAAVERSLAAIAALLPEPRRPHLRVVSPSQNECSIALWVRSEAGVALLGADVERQDTDDRGWGAIVALDPAAKGRAQLVKVPHHGSESGHNDRMWADLLCDAPDAVLAPWRLMGNSLPTDSDVERLSRLAPAAVLAGQAGQKPKRFDRAVERTLKEVAIWRQTALGRLGHARARCSPAGEGWTVECVNNAAPLSAAA